MSIQHPKNRGMGKFPPLVKAKNNITRGELKIPTTREDQKVITRGFATRDDIFGLHLWGIENSHHL